VRVYSKITLTFVRRVKQSLARRVLRDYWAWTSQTNSIKFRIHTFLHFVERKSIYARYLKQKTLLERHSV